jgi:hypothetical protein
MSDRDDRIASRRSELQHKLAATPDLGSLPASTTRDELASIETQRQHAERTLANFDATVARYRSLGDVETDTRWRAELTAWRQALCDELMTIKSPVRDAVTMGRRTNLTLSIKVIDFGLDKALSDSGYALTNLRLGELMRESGYEVTGADPNTNAVGTLPWYGSLREVERRLSSLAQQRAQAEAALESVLMSDDERQRQEAEAQQLTDAYNAMTVKVGPTSDGLVAYRNGEVYAVQDMTEIQRRAFERANKVFVAEQRQRRAEAPRVEVTG